MVYFGKNLRYKVVLKIEFLFKKGESQVTKRMNEVKVEG
jgi:hypothetical protein